tara:strand:+ start:1181 stop:1504 length:324 start_codon:yes stop_codon:yes gene_type:complete
MGTTKTRVLVDQELIDKHGAVITAEDVMRITGITSKTTALKRMDSETDQQVLSKKGARMGYAYSEAHQKNKPNYKLEHFSNKARRDKHIKATRPYYDPWFRMALKII